MYLIDPESQSEFFYDLESLAERVEELVSGKGYQKLSLLLKDLPAVDLAELCEQLSREARGVAYRLLPKELAAEVFVEMSAELCRELIESLTDAELRETLSELYLDDTVDIIEEMPAGVVKRILKQSSPDNRAQINELLRYPKGSCGSIMTTEYVRLTPDMTVDAALRHIKRVAIDKETVYTCYVTDKERRLIGLVTAKSLLLSELDSELSGIIEENVIYATTAEDREEVALKFKKYGFIALPVVDNEGRLVGIVTVDDAIDVLSEEAEEDFAKMAAITPTDDEYLKTSALSLFMARIPWLLLLMISATLSSTMLGFFEAALIPVLVLFVPMLMDSGGNSGSQASVTAIRALSVGEIRPRDWYRVISKELLVGVLAGASMAVVAFAKVMLVDRLIMNNPEVTVAVAVAVSLTLFATVCVAKLIGSSLPLLAKAIGLDPAVMASPFITTLVDAVSLAVYFVIAGFGFGLKLQ
ncbi:MAG: magnesium transporter [Clostridia bacterium]|nr:magnesium transporter [Clostridia bacterium]